MPSITVENKRSNSDNVLGYEKHGTKPRLCWAAGVVAEAWEGVAACLVERLHLEKEDGTLDTKKLVSATAGMGGKDIWVSPGAEKN